MSASSPSVSLTPGPESFPGASSAIPPVTVPPPIAVMPGVAQSLTELDLRDGNHFPPSRDQRTQESYTAFAVASVLTYYRSLAQHRPVITASNTLDYGVVVSPTFMYNQLNVVNGTHVNGGIWLYDALRLTQDVGEATLDEMPPYDENDLTSTPSPDVVKRAIAFRISGYSRISPDTESMRRWLQLNTPILVDIVMTDRLDSLGPADKWLWALDEHGSPGNTVRDPATGAEAATSLVIIGYSDQRKAFLAQNSWGQDWGDNHTGTFWISYDVL